MVQTNKMPLAAHLIDPLNQTIKTITLHRQGDVLAEIYQHLECQLITAAELFGGASLYVDDEGLVKNPRAFFSVDGYPEPFAGRGLVIGLDEDGEDTGAPVSLDELKARTSFILPFAGDLWGRYRASNPPGVRAVELMPFRMLVATLEQEARAAKTAEAANFSATHDADEVCHG